MEHLADGLFTALKALRGSRYDMLFVRGDAQLRKRRKLI
jgi:hypothetical protein